MKLIYIKFKCKSEMSTTRSLRPSSSSSWLLHWYSTSSCSRGARATIPSSMSSCANHNSSGPINASSTPSSTYIRHSSCCRSYWSWPFPSSGPSTTSTTWPHCWSTDWSSCSCSTRPSNSSFTIRISSCGHSHWGPKWPPSSSTCRKPKLCTTCCQLYSTQPT